MRAYKGLSSLINMLTVFVFVLLRGTEICDVDLALRHPEVLWLNVSVEIALIMHFLNRLKHLYSYQRYDFI
jgi:hypothetical protein